MRLSDAPPSPLPTPVFHRYSVAELPLFESVPQLQLHSILTQHHQTAIGAAAGMQPMPLLLPSPTTDADSEMVDRLLVDGFDAGMFDFDEEEGECAGGIRTAAAQPTTCVGKRDRPSSCEKQVDTRPRIGGWASGE